MCTYPLVAGLFTDACRSPASTPDSRSIAAFNHRFPDWLRRHKHARPDAQLPHKLVWLLDRAGWRCLQCAQRAHQHPGTSFEAVSHRMHGHRGAGPLCSPKEWVSGSVPPSQRFTQRRLRPRTPSPAASFICEGLAWLTLAALAIAAELRQGADAGGVLAVQLQPQQPRLQAQCDGHPVPRGANGACLRSLPHAAGPECQ